MSILTEIVGEEKKDEVVDEVEIGVCDDTADNGLSDSLHEGTEAFGVLSIQSHQTASITSPIPVTNLGISPRATPNNDSLVSGEDAFVSSSLKQFVNHQDNYLKSFMGSIDGITATPGRIEGMVQDGIFDEDDSEDEKLGLTPLKSRLASVELDASKRGARLFSSPLEEGAASNETTKEDEHRGGVLFASPLAQTADFENVGEEAEHREAVLLKSPPNLKESIASVQEPNISVSCELALSNESYLLEKEVNQSTTSIKSSSLETLSDEAPLSREEFDSDLAEADLSQELAPPSEGIDVPNVDLFQSALSNQVKSPVLETTLTETASPQNASPLEAAGAADLSMRSTALMDFIRQSKEKETDPIDRPVAQPSASPIFDHQQHKNDESNENDGAVEEVEEDDIPEAFREMFANTDCILQKELASPYLHTNKSIDIEGADNFCDDYIIKPDSEPKPKHSTAAPSKNVKLPFASPTDCVPIDTANLNKTNALEAETTIINLDSLKEVFLKAESQLESAESCINEDQKPEKEEPDQRSEVDTTFDTANFSMGGLMAAAGDFFFDTHDEFVDALDAEEASIVEPTEAASEKSVEVKDSESAIEADEDMALSAKKERGASSSTADCESSVDIVEAEEASVDQISEQLVVENYSEPAINTNEDKPLNAKTEYDGMSTNLSENGSSAADTDSTVDITQTLDRVGEYLKRMTMKEAESDEGSSEASDAAEIVEVRDSTLVSLAVETDVVAKDVDGMDDPTPLARITASFKSSLQSDIMDEKMASPEKSTLAADEECAEETVEPDSIVNESDAPVEKSDSPIKPDTPGHREDNASSLEASGRSDEMDESMFMPNVSMEISLIASPVPAINHTPKPALQPTSEEDEDSVLSDEEFFPNRDLAKKTTAKASTVCSKENTVPPAAKPSANPTRARSLSLGRADQDADKKSSIASQASRRSQPSMSRLSSTTNAYVNTNKDDKKTRVSAATLSRRARQNSRKTVAPKTPPSSMKPAQKRTKLSTITNTVDSPKRTAKPLKSNAVGSTSLAASKPAVAKKRVARVASKASSNKTATGSNETNLVGVSPRSSSMRRSLVAVTKSQRQSNIPKASSGGSSIHRSERLAQLAKPRAVVKKDITPANTATAQKKSTAAKPPSFLNRERKKSTVKSTEERQLEEMSSIKPFKARRIKGSTVKVRSRFNTPRGPAHKPTQVQSDGKPFRSLRESVDNYNFREQPTTNATPINRKNMSAPSFAQNDSTKTKQTVTTLGESLNKYDFRATPATSTPINPNKFKPPSFLSRPSPTASYNQVKSSEELELEECKHQFKACPLPMSSVTRSRRPASRSRPREGLCFTTPRPPKLHTSVKQMKTPILTQDDVELQRQFHARPLPASIYGTSTPMRYYGKVPQQSADDIELSKQFHALPLPSDIYGRSSVGNDDAPFHVRALEQYERAMDRKKQMIEEEMEQMKRSRERKATPVPPTNWEARPIRIEKSHKKLVQPRPPRLSLDARSMQRQHFDCQVQQKQDAEAAAEATRREEESRAEEEETRRRRSLAIEEGGLCFRARPVSIKYE